MDILDILGLVWDTQLVIAQKDLSPYGRQAVVFLTSLATDNLGPVCPRGEQTGVLPPFCEATPPPPTPLVFVSCGDSVRSGCSANN